MTRRRDAGATTRKANRRGAARLAAVQALYQMDIAGTGLNEILAEFESHWIGREVEGEQYLPAEAAFFRDIVGGVRARAAPARSDDRQGAAPRLAAQAHRGDDARGAARRRLRARHRAATFRRASSCRNMSTSRMRFSTSDETGMVNAVLDQLARELRAGEFGRAAQVGACPQRATARDMADGRVSAPTR